MDRASPVLGSRRRSLGGATCATPGAQYGPVGIGHKLMVRGEFRQTGDTDDAARSSVTGRVRGQSLRKRSDSLKSSLDFDGVLIIIAAVPPPEARQCGLCRPAAWRRAN